MTLKIDEVQLPDDIRQKPALREFVNAINTHTTSEETALAAVIVAAARAIDVLETRLLALETGEIPDEGDRTYVK